MATYQPPYWGWFFWHFYGGVIFDEGASQRNFIVGDSFNDFGVTPENGQVGLITNAVGGDNATEFDVVTSDDNRRAMWLFRAGAVAALHTAETAGRVRATISARCLKNHFGLDLTTGLRSQYARSRQVVRLGLRALSARLDCETIEQSSWTESDIDRPVEAEVNNPAPNVAIPSIDLDFPTADTVITQTLESNLSFPAGASILVLAAIVHRMDAVSYGWHFNQHIESEWVIEAIHVEMV
jgi:hypothetical protein